MSDELPEKDVSKNQTDKPSEEKQELKDISNPAVEMEVHHHPHVHHSKKWKDYLFEFLMLFLAVTAGFLWKTGGNTMWRPSG